MKRKKSAITLIEIMIVVFLITLITGAIGYNMKGALERGRKFRTEQGIAELYDLLHLCVLEGHTVSEIRDDPGTYLKELGLAKDPDKLLKDGWGDPYEIVMNPSKDDFIIRSKHH